MRRIDVDAAQIGLRTVNPCQNRRRDLLRPPLMLSRGTSTFLQVLPVETGAGAITTGHKDDVKPGGVSISYVDVHEHLRLILASEWFARSRRMSRFLQFVVNETVAGRTEQLCEYSIGVAVFDLEHSFQPSLNSIVRNDARRLRHKLLEYYRNTTDTYRLLIDIPKGSYVPSFEPVLKSAGPDGEESPRARFLLKIARDGQQLWTGECECKAGETVEVHLQLRSST